MDNKTEQIFIINTSEPQGLIGPQKSTETTQANLQNVLTTNVCRTCAAATEFVIPIFHGEGLQNNLAEKIHKHLPIQVSEHDDLPQVLCYQCASTLLAWHELVQCCVQADRALRTNSGLTQNAQPGTSTEVTGLQTQLQQEGEKNKNECNQQSFTSIVQKVLSDHLHVDETEINHTFNCLECGNMTLSDANNLARHLNYQHGLITAKGVQAFLENNIMCEESLNMDLKSSDTESSDDSTSADWPAKKKIDEQLQNYHCPFCKNIFSSGTRLVYHLNNHVELHTEGGYNCAICDFETASKKDFVTHLQQQHVEKSPDHLRLTCRSCGYAASDSDNLTSHIAAEHNCEEPARDIKSIAEKNPVKAQKINPAECPLCQKCFSDKYIMLNHYERHSTQYWYLCDRCPKKYATETGRRRHAELAHEGQLRFVCSTCGEAFNTKQHRDIHERIHSGELPFVCQLCQKGFRAKNGLVRHMEMHLDVRNYACHLCPKKFRKRTHLNYHLGVHERKNAAESKQQK